MQQFFTRFLFLSAQVSQELPEGSIIHFDKELIIQTGIQLLNVALLTVLLVFILYKPVRSFMQGRTQRIRGEIEAARLEREAAQEMKEKYETMLAQVESEREAILLAAHKKAMEKSDQLLFEARREAEVLHSRAMTELETERKNLVDDMKKEMIELSLLMAGRFVEVAIDADTQARLIDEAFDGWEGA